MALLWLRDDDLPRPWRPRRQPRAAPSPEAVGRGAARPHGPAQPQRWHVGRSSDPTTGQRAASPSFGDDIHVRDVHVRRPGGAGRPGCPRRAGRADGVRVRRGPAEPLGLPGRGNPTPGAAPVLRRVPRPGFRRRPSRHHRRPGGRGRVDAGARRRSRVRGGACSARRGGQGHRPGRPRPPGSACWPSRWMPSTRRATTTTSPSSPSRRTDRTRAWVRGCSPTGWPSWTPPATPDTSRPAVRTTHACTGGTGSSRPAHRWRSRADHRCSRCGGPARPAADRGSQIGQHPLPRWAHSG